METFQIIGMDEEVSSAPAQLEDGVYPYTYQGYTQGQHAADQFDGRTYPIVTAKLALELTPTNTYQHEERFKMFIEPGRNTNERKIADFFLSLGAKPNPSGKVPSGWNTMIGRTGWLKLETSSFKDRSGGDRKWQSCTFIWPENVEKEKAKFNASKPEQAVTPKPTWGSGNTSWS